MSVKVTKKALEAALEEYGSLVEMYPDNEAYLQRYAEMLLTVGREATATITLQHLHDVIANRSEKEAKVFALKYPQIGRIQLNDMIFEDHDKHAVAGKIIFELLGKIWLRLHQKKLKEGQVICRHDDLSDSLTLIVKGKAEAYAVDANDVRTLVEKVDELDILGEHTFFKPSKMYIDVFVASEEAIIVEVPRLKLQKMIADNHYLEKVLSQRSIFRTNAHALARNSVFHAMPLKLRRYLARKLTLRHFEANCAVYKLQQPLDGIDILLAGKVCHLMKNNKNETILLPPLLPSSIVGDVRLKGKGTPSNEELFAKSKATLAHIAFNDILTVSTAFPLLKERLLKRADEQKILMMQNITQSKNT